jgi:hypothetical protein
LRFVLGFALLYLSLAPQLMAAQSAVAEEVEANPGRPTVSTPATLTPVGYLQFETGFLPAFQSPEFSSRYSLTEAIKFAVKPRLEFLVLAEPIAHFTAEGRTANRVADIFVGAQFVIHHGEGANPTLAVSYFHRVYDGGAPEFDFGSPTNSVLILASADVKGFHYDAKRFFHRTRPITGAPRPVWPVTYNFASTPASLHIVWRDMALYSAVSEE